MSKKIGGQFHFRIDGFTPESLPMARLAVYMSDLATLLGHEERVHFVRVAKGSADLVHVIENEQIHEVKNRLHLVKKGVGPRQAQHAFLKLNEILAQDKKTATIFYGRGKLLSFPGADAVPASYGPIAMRGQLDGMLIRVGGKDDTKPVHLLTKDNYYTCNADTETARKLAPYYEKQVRVYGNGRWFRESDGGWHLEKFDIDGFDILDEASLQDMVVSLQSIPGNGWKSVASPLEELAQLRGYEGSTD